MEDTLGVPPQPRIGDALPPASGARAADWAAYYATDRRWEVFPGTRLVAPEDGGAPVCSCGDAGCPEPGGHPLDPRGAATASSSPTAVRRQWRDVPDAPVLLRTGRAFDVLEVAEDAGCLALARLRRAGVATGPVVSAEGPRRRLQFLVRAGGAAKLADLLRAAGWPVPDRLDLHGRGDGDWIAAPSASGGVARVRWAVAPTAENLALPEAGAVVPGLAYACGHSARLPVARGAGADVARPPRPARPPGR